MVLFDDCAVILYTENTKLHRKSFEVVNKFVKVAEHYKI